MQSAAEKFQHTTTYTFERAHELVDGIRWNVQRGQIHSLHTEMMRELGLIQGDFTMQDKEGGGHQPSNRVRIPVATFLEWFCAT
jgi:hypothetical protein